MRSKIDQRNKDGKEAANVNNEDQRFDLWQQASKIRIHKQTEGNDGVEQQSSLPLVGDIVRIVQNQQALDERAAEEGSGAEARLPRNDGDPASQVTQELRATRRCQNRNPSIASLVVNPVERIHLRFPSGSPIVLAASKRDPKESQSRA